MTKKELQIILKEGEGYQIEFKESLDKPLAKEMVAFANSSGGRIFLGVNDKGEIKGAKLSNKIKAAITDIAQKCDPSISPSLNFQFGIIIIDIPEGQNKPYQCKEGFFIRIGSLSQKMKRDEIIKFILLENLVHFDREVNDTFNESTDLSQEHLSRFLDVANLSLNRKDYKSILINLGVGIQERRKFTINNAGILLFAKKSKKFFRHNFVTCVLYKGNNKTKVLDRIDLENDLLSNYYDAFIFLQKHLRLEYIINDAGPRKEILEIPEEALREALLNALIHRDYYDQRVGIFIEIFDDRVEITNKGALLFEKKYFGKISLPRNPLLFDLFHRLHLIEKIGSGIERIKTACREAKIKSKFDTGEFFIVSFLRKKAQLRTAQKTTQKTTQKILQLLRDNPNITRKQLSDSLGISEDGVKYHLKQFKEKGLIKRIGPDKGGHWKTEEK